MSTDGPCPHLVSSVINFDDKFAIQAAIDTGLRSQWAFDQVWETEGKRQWRIVHIDWSYFGRGIVAREVTPGGLWCGRAACFDATGHQFDGSAKLVRLVS